MGGWGFRFLPAAALFLLLLIPGSAPGQDEEKPEEDPSPLGGEHTSRDPKKCKKCSRALSKALSYIRRKGNSTGWVQTMMLGWLGLVDRNYSNFTGKALQKAGQAKSMGFNGNWYIAIPAIFCAAAYYRYKDGRAAGAMSRIAADARKNQHKTGGWHHNKNFKMQGYSDDLGILTAMLFGMFQTMKGHKRSVNKGMLEKCEKNLESIMGSTGIGYGTGKGKGDRAGSRGAYALMGLYFGGQKDHPFFAKLRAALPRQVASLDKGHAVGCLHFLSVAIAHYLAGIYDDLAKVWIDKLIEKQQGDGSILLGDDEAGGGEEKTIGGKVGSTAVFAIMLLLQQPGRLEPPKKRGAKGKNSGPRDSPFGKPRGKVETPSSKKKDKDKDKEEKK
jgi:hypothetical protein